MSSETALDSRSENLDPQTLLCQDAGEQVSITFSPDHLVAFQGFHITANGCRDISRAWHDRLLSPQQDDSSALQSPGIASALLSAIPGAILLVISPIICFHGAIASSSPFLLPCLVQFFSLFFAFYLTMLDSAISDETSIAPYFIMSTSPYHSGTYLSPRSVCYFRVFTSYAVTETEVAIGPFARVDYNEEFSYGIEVVTQGEARVFGRFQSQTLALDVATALNNFLSDYRTHHNPSESLSTPPSLFLNLNPFESAQIDLTSTIPSPDEMVLRTKHSSIVSIPDHKLSYSQSGPTGSFFLAVGFAFCFVLFVMLAASGEGEVHVGSSFELGFVCFVSYWTILPSKYILVGLLCNRFTAVLASVIYTAWAYTMLNIRKKKKTLTVINSTRCEDLPRNWIKWLLDERVVVKVHDVAKVRLCRQKKLTLEECRRRKVPCNEYVGGSRYSLNLISHVGLKLASTGNMTEAEALFLAQKLQNTFPRLF